MDKSIQLQQSIRNNVEDLQSFVQGIQDWQKEMNTKETRDQLKTKEKTKQVVTEDKESAVREKEKGNQHVRNKKWNDAILSYTTAIEYYPHDPVFYANRGLCFLKKNSLREAETDCTIAIQLDDKYVKAYQRRASVRIKLGQINEAKCDLLKVLELEPDNAESLKELEKLKTHLKDVPVRKEENFENSNGSDSSQANEYKEKGNICVKEEKWNEAIEYYTKACEYDLSYPVFYANRALCYLKIGNPSKAIEDGNSALALDKNYIKAYHRRSQAKFLLGLYDQAKDDILAGLKLAPDNVTLKKELVKIEYEIKREKEIKEAMDKLVRDPYYKLANFNDEYIKRGKVVLSIKKGEKGTLPKVIQPYKAPRRLIPIMDDVDMLGDILSAAAREARERIDASQINARREDTENSGIENSRKDSIHTVTNLHDQITSEEPSTIKKSKIDSHSENASLSTISLSVKNMIPKNYLQFDCGWRSFRRDKYARLQFLFRVPYEYLPLVLGECMDCYMLFEIFESLAEYSKSSEFKLAHKYMYQFSKMERFKMVMLTASKKDFENINTALEGMAAYASKQDIEHLRKIYLHIQ